MLLRRLCVLVSAAFVQIASQPVISAELPVPCIAGSCGSLVPGFVQSGQAGATAVGNTLTVTQTTERAILNWQSFNVSADGRVIFAQPDSSAIALNRIHQGSPSQIFGAVEANGQIYLVNQNGIVFGTTARVKTAGLVASSLNISDDVFASGIVAPDLVNNSRPAFESDGRATVLDASGNPVLGPDGLPLQVQLRVEAGAKIVTTTGGRVVLASRTVDNAGSIETPDGQTLIAAGEKVYLQASGDPALRGLLVEVDTGGTAWNRATGDISARRGNVTIAGLAVNQEGRVSATTSVSANGSIRLLGRDTMQLQVGNGNSVSIGATRGGTVKLGAGSHTEVLPELADTTTAIDDQVQLPSTVELSGRSLSMGAGAQILAPGGKVTFTARQDPRLDGADPASRIRLDAGALIDVSGSTASAAVERNLVTVELRANELRDSPLQRDGPLRGKPVVVDARIGTPFGDVSGALASTPRDIAERTSRGGSVLFQSDGDVGIATGATIDVSGGAIVYRPGVIQTSLLIGANGQVVDIGHADPNQLYVGLLNPTVTRSFDRWGVKETVTGPQIGQYDPGYIEGRSAGTVQINAPAMVLNGNFEGHATAGQYQRDPATIPTGGQLILGTRTPEGGSLDYRTPSVVLTGVRPNIAFGGSGAIPSSVPLELATDFLTTGGFTRAQISSNGSITLAANTPLTLAPGSTLDLRGSAIDIRSDITASSGSLLFAADLTANNLGGAGGAPIVSIADDVTLDVRGRWQNDLANAGGPLWRNGGTIDLAARSIEGAAGHLKLGDNVKLLASGGASLSSSGALTGGTGGTIALRSALHDSIFDIGDNVTMEAFGVQGARGGTFTLEARYIDIVNGERWSGAQVFDPLNDLEGALQLGSAMFGSHGFAAFNLVATGPARSADNPDALRVVDGTTINARAATLAIQGSQTQRAATANVADFSSRFLQPDYLQSGSTVSLRVEPRDSTSQSLGRLHVGEGTLITGAARSTFNFASPGGLLLAGQVYSAGGAINATVTTPSTAFDVGFLPNLRLELAPTARLDVSGALVLRPNDAGLRFGDVLAGGNVTLAAERGSVLLRSGSVIDVSGTAGDLDIAAGPAERGYTRSTIASAAGSVTVRAPESILLGGDLRAFAGTGGSLRATGGSLDVQLTRLHGFTFGEGGLATTYPDTPRVIRVIPDAFAGTPANGQAVIEAGVVAHSGFDALHLEADTLSFDAGANLVLGRELRLDAPVIDVAPGATTRLAAPYVALGPTSARSQELASAGTGRLEIAGDLVDVIGNVSTRRAGVTSISSTGDIRLRGVESFGESRGSLNSTGDIELAAQRIYPTTISQFTVDAQDSVVRIARTGIDATVPLSVGGRLTVHAREINQGGALLAPFGQINLVGTERVSLGAGSVTSVAATGALLPFGRVELGTQWLYGVGSQLVEQTGIPERRVTIDSANVELGANSLIDVSGGGDLYAYSWLPGTGGSRDVLSSSANNGYYAVLPGVGNYAPYDPQEAVGSTLKPGDSVYLSGGNGLAAGVYALLPARYALLPGAYLVRRVDGYTDITAQANTPRVDGGALVSGYRTVGNTGLGDTRTSGFVILPGSAARDLASYQDFKASDFFAQRAARNEAASVLLPRDAGYLGLFASNSLIGRGTVATSAAKDGRGALIDISAQALELVSATRGGGVTPGAVRVDVSDVNHWGAASVLFGGRRSADGSQIEALADSVLFDSGTVFDSREFLAVANSTVTVANGTTLASTGTSAVTLGERELELTSSTGAAPALLAVSDSNRFLVTRANTGGTAGRVNLEAGSSIDARGSITVDAPAGATLAGSILATGADVTLRSGHLVFGSGIDDSGITVTSNILDQLNGASALRFASDNAIDFQESLDLGTAGAPIGLIELSANNITAAPGVAALNLRAREIALRGGASQAQAGAAGSATLTMSGDRIALDAGFLDFSGLATLELDARGDFLANGASTLRTPGDLRINANRMLVAAGGDARLRSEGDITVSRATDPLSGITPQLGGSLVVSGRNVNFGGTALLPSGSMTLHADQNLALSADAVIDVSGREVGTVDHRIGTPGGRIALEGGAGIEAASGSLLSTNGARDAANGQISAASAGRVALDSTMTGGRVNVDAGSIDDFAALASRIEAGGFGDARSIRARTGDLALGAGIEWVAKHVSLAADTGRVDVSGSVRAESGNERASIELFGGAGVSLHEGAALRAGGTTDLGRGGLVTIAATGGSVDLAPGSSIDVSGSQEGGAITIRARAMPDDVAVDRLGAAITGVTAITLSPTLVFTDLPEFVDATVLTNYANAARDWLAAADAVVRGRLGTPGGAALEIQPGLDLQRVGDLSLAAMDFSAWRFNGEPAQVAFRATGSVNVNGNLSDGFTTLGAGPSARFDLRTDHSTSLQLIAGADLNAANSATTQAGAHADLFLNDAIVRTGTGSLTLAAARDVGLGQGSSVYTAGVAGAPSLNIPRGPLAVFATGGGALTINAGRDIQGSQVIQAVGDWQPRQGRTGEAPLPTRWGSDLRAFRWNAGTLGGGDMVVSAGRDAIDLTAATADSGFQREDGSLLHLNAGVMSIDAGRDVSSPFLHVASGDNRVTAGGGLTRSRLDNAGTPLGALFSMQDAQLDVVARANVEVASIFNPTMLFQPTALAAQRSYFLTYGERAGFNATSIAGDVNGGVAPESLGSYIGTDTLSGNTAVAFQTLPPSLSLRALSGDVVYSGDLLLAPATNSNLDLYAARDIRFVGRIVMSDSGPNEVPSPLQPAATPNAIDAMQDESQALRHSLDLTPASVIAGRDLIDVRLLLPKFAQVSAGRDILDLSLQSQNLRATDQTRVSAGRDVRLSQSFSKIEIGGPGRFDLVAGRDIDLGFSEGISTTGRLRNALLPVRGADITAIAGFTQALGADKFVDDIIAPTAEYAALLIEYVKRLSGDASLDLDAARAKFRLMDSDTQRPLLLNVFFRELVLAGREANTVPGSNFERGYAAIDALFAGSRDPDPEGTAGFVNPYAGDLKLAFSRIYTLSGGDINLLVPGGIVDVGLAVPPAVGAPTRKPSDLGIVAQRAGSVRIFSSGDVLVNQSRIFTLAGGDIAVWSTLGDIDAGRGAKSAISAPAPQVLVDGSGNVVIDLAGAVAGSGIRGILTDPDAKPGDVDLIAPAGIVNAGDAGIGAAGNLNVAAQQVVGLDNIQVGGASSGVPSETSNLGASLSGVSAVSSGASSSATKDAAGSANSNPKAALAETALGWLDVFLEGFGEEVCKPSDTECLERNRK